MCSSLSPLICFIEHERDRRSTRTYGSLVNFQRKVAPKVMTHYDRATSGIIKCLINPSSSTKFASSRLLIARDDPNSRRDNIDKQTNWRFPLPKKPPRGMKPRNLTQYRRTARVEYRYAARCLYERAFRDDASATSRNCSERIRRVINVPTALRYSYQL